MANAFSRRRATLAPQEPAPALGYPRGLDGLRAVAVLAVMASHLDHRLVPGGFLGVELFFVLSGFLITTLILEELDRHGRVSLRRFYARRALRLFPALALVVAACAAWAVVRPDFLPERGNTLHALPYVLLYVANWASGAFHVGLGLLDHTWSLAVEEQFYLVWPAALLLILHSFSRRAALTACLVGVAAVGIFRAIFFEVSPSSRDFIYTCTRLDGLLFGCAIAFGRSIGRLNHLSARAARTMGVVGAAGVLAVYALVSPTSSLPYVGGFTLLDFAAALVIVGVVHGAGSPVDRLLSSKPLAGVGRISYGLYLWQTPVTVILLTHLSGTALPLKLAIVWPVIFAAALASFYCVERPALRLKSRFAPTPTGREAEQAIIGGREPV